MEVTAVPTVPTMFLTVGTPMPVTATGEAKVDALFNALKAHGLVCYAVNADGTEDRMNIRIPPACLCR